MPTTLPRSRLPGPVHAATPRRLALALVALGLLATLVTAGRNALQVREKEALAREKTFAVSSAARLERCVEGALLFSDVRWAVVCQALADKGQGNGFADCELPDALAASLYASLQQEERVCAVEAAAFRTE